MHILNVKFLPPPQAQVFKYLVPTGGTVLRKLQNLQEAKSYWKSVTVGSDAFEHHSLAHFIFTLVSEVRYSVTRSFLFILSCFYCLLPALQGPTILYSSFIFVE